MHRVQKAPPGITKSWWVAKSYTVRAFRRSSGAQTFVRGAALKTLTTVTKVDTSRIADHITLFLGMAVEEPDQPFKVTPSALARRGVTRRHPHNRPYGAPRTDHMKQLWKYQGPDAHGHIAVLLEPPDLFGKCVIVQHIEKLSRARAYFLTFFTGGLRPPDAPN